MLIEDIEDITAEATPSTRLNNIISLKPKTKPKSSSAVSFTHAESATKPHFLNKIFLKTWGCSHNSSDTEYMAGLLHSYGYDLTFNDSEKQDCDLWILNSCTVKNPSEQTFINYIQDAKLKGNKVVVCGCIPEADPKNKNWNEFSSVSVLQIDRIVEVVEETLNGNTVKLTDKKKKDSKPQLNMPKIRKNPFVEIIPINTGCLNNCTYCKTKHARGDLISYSEEEIIKRVNECIREGVVEIWLTSEDTGAYGKVLEEYSKEGTKVMLRVGMTNPPYILSHLDEISEILNHENVYKFIHIPVQSGSNRVLNEMRRGYTVKDFEHVVDVLREKVEGICVCTDVICGFPSEDDDDFKDTLKLLEKYKFPVLHISQFYPRTGTPAAQMHQIPRTIIKDRSREVTKLFNSYSTFDSIGHVFDVLFTEETTGKDNEDVQKNDVEKREACWLGHNKYYHQVLVKKSLKSDNLLGKSAKVKITSCGKFYLMGEIESISNASAFNVNSNIVLERVGRNNRKVRVKYTKKEEERDTKDKLVGTRDFTFDNNWSKYVVFVAVIYLIIRIINNL